MVVAIALGTAVLLARRRRLRLESRASSRWQRFRLGRQWRQACLRSMRHRLGLIAVLGVNRLAGRFARSRARRRERSSRGMVSGASRSWRQEFQIRRPGCWARRDVTWRHSTRCRLTRWSRHAGCFRRCKWGCCAGPMAAGRRGRRRRPAPHRALGRVQRRWLVGSGSSHAPPPLRVAARSGSRPPPCGRWVGWLIRRRRWPLARLQIPGLWWRSRRLQSMGARERGRRLGRRCRRCQLERNGMRRCVR